jgi:hypothetical protein
MTLATPQSSTRNPSALEIRIRALIAEVRDSVSGYVFDARPASLSSVTELLAIAPVLPCRQLVEEWRALGAKATTISNRLPHEDRLLLELVLGMYDWSAGSNTFPALPVTPTAE